jgi:hypothetical protein
MFVHKHQNWNYDRKSKNETFAIHIFQLEPKPKLGCKQENNNICGFADKRKVIVYVFH